MNGYRADPRRIADSFIRTVEIYDVDGVLIDVDTATLAEAVRDHVLRLLEAWRLIRL